MAPYVTEGSLTTDKRVIDDSDGWDSQSDWEAYQSASNVEIVNGSVQLAEFDIPASAIHQWPYEEGSGATVTDSIGPADGTLSGASWVSDANAEGGYRLSFDGTDDSAEYAVDISQYSEWMLCATIQATSEFNAFGWIFEQSDDFGEAGLRYNCELHVGDGSEVVSAQASTDIFDGNKHRVACYVVEGSEIGVAVDGTVDDTTAFGSMGPVSSTLHSGYHERLGLYTALDKDNPIIYTDSSSQTIQGDYDAQPW